jgi:hypothetical protein
MFQVLPQDVSSRQPGRGCGKRLLAVAGAGGCCLECYCCFETGAEAAPKLYDNMVCSGFQAVKE